MTKFLNILKSGVALVLRSITDQWFYILGLLWILISFMYIGKPQFWIILGFGTIFTGVQNIINEIKLKN